MRHLPSLRLSIAAVLLAAAPVEGARAASAFDGNWSVSITTDRGDCGPASVSLVIRNGSLRYAGDSSVIISGRVAGNGAIRVSVASGDRKASGTGRLSASAGGGTWRGTGSTGACIGRWSASRF